MRFSLMTEPQFGGSYDDILRAARFAESAGLASFARSDHWYWQGQPRAATDAFATLAGLARDTSTIRLCVLVSPITFRHPTVIAKNAGTIDQMSGGRLDLGVGTGWNQFEHEALGLAFPDSKERWARFEDALRYLQAAFGKGPGSYRGEFYSLEADVLPKPSGLRLIVGGSGPKRTPTLAGQFADELNLTLRDPQEVPQRVEAMRRAAAGRDVEVTLMTQAIVGRTDAEYQNMLSAEASRRGIDETDMEKEWSKRGELFGPPGRVAEQIARFEQAGVERIYLQRLDVTDFDGLTATVEGVLS